METSMEMATVDECDQICENDKLESWTRDVQNDFDGEIASMMGEMEQIRSEFEVSKFYHDFRNEVMSSPIAEQILKVLGSESKMKMVIYGIGSISDRSYTAPKKQLSLAILMKKDFTWIGEIEVYDPILSAIEIQVLECLGFSVLPENEHAKRRTPKPTMFFMPRCDLQLFNNLIEENWKPNLLSNIIIFGSSLDIHVTYFLMVQEEHARKFTTSSNDPIREVKRKFSKWRMLGHIFAAKKFTNEFRMRTIFYDDNSRTSQVPSLYQRSFLDFSWQFFSSPSVEKMQLIKQKTMKEFGLSMVKGRLFVLPKKRKRKARILAPMSSHDNYTSMAPILFSYVAYYFYQIKALIPFNDEVAKLGNNPKSWDLLSAITMAALLIGAPSLLLSLLVLLKITFVLVSAFLFFYGAPSTSF